MFGWNDYFQHIEFVVGLGNRIRFWQDKWCGDRALLDRFPTLYACSSHREVTIDSVLIRPNAGGLCEWNVTFGRDFNDWEIDLVVEFFQLLASNTPSNEGPDGLRWKGRKDGIFTSRSFYHVLNVRLGVPFPWKVIWAAKAPPRVSFFIWTATWRKILNCDNLMRRGYTMVSRCCLCCSNGETVDHLLLHCPVLHMLWKLSFLFVPC
uniref:Reverse transcriptase zinc-binding domain-containing protein n=1 Tax=Fagus sylvatica TaxID=28930 RepID=A0A2N9EFC4_FAGSY